MSRLIDAELLEEKLPVRAAAIVRLAPTVDAVEVVRCKYCKYNNGAHKCLNENSIIKIPKDTDYCSYGKRKDFFDEFNEPHTSEEKHRVAAAAELFGNEVK